MLLPQSKFYKIVAYKRCCLDPNNKQMGGFDGPQNGSFGTLEKKKGGGGGLTSMASQIREMGTPNASCSTTKTQRHVDEQAQAQTRLSLLLTSQYDCYVLLCVQ